MTAPYGWMPLVAALVAPLLAWLLYLGREGPRRASRLLTIPVAIALVVGGVALLNQFWLTSGPVYGANPLAVANFVSLAAGSVSGLLTYAIWTLLLADAARAARPTRLIFLTLALALTLAFQFAFALSTWIPLMGGLRVDILKLGIAGWLVAALLQDLVALAALIAALAFPASASWDAPRPDPIQPAA